MYTYISIHIHTYQCFKELERLVKPGSVNYRSRRKEIIRENTGPQQKATNKRKIHTHLKTTEKKTTVQDYKSILPINTSRIIS